MLQNVHLMPKWCVELEKKLDVFAIENSHPNFRLFLSADPSKGIPIGILERSIKLTNEPPQGMLANLRRSFALFPKEDFEDKDAKVKSILFALCHFHSLMLERKKFGPMGYNMMQPGRFETKPEGTFTAGSSWENGILSRETPCLVDTFGPCQGILSLRAICVTRRRCCTTTWKARLQ